MQKPTKYDKISEFNRNRVRKGGQLKGTKHRGELEKYYALLKLLSKHELGKRQLREKLRTDGLFIKKSMELLEKKMYIQAVDDSTFPKYKITKIGIKLCVYLEELVK